MKVHNLTDREVFLRSITDDNKERYLFIRIRLEAEDKNRTLVLTMAESGENKAA